LQFEPIKKKPANILTGDSMQNLLKEKPVSHTDTPDPHTYIIFGHLKLARFVAAFFLNASTKFVPHEHRACVFNCRLKVKLPMSKQHSMDSYVVTKLKLHAMKT
jgi:hypothetical protein